MMLRLTLLRLLAAGLLLGLGISLLQAQSTISSDDTGKFSWAANAGWFNWRPTATDGVVTTRYFCTGFIWSGNIGYINMGNGPANGLAYANTSGTDFGVNIQGDGALRGFAWSGNTGWLVFEPTGDPRINLLTGAFAGFAWSPNLGWIALSTIPSTVTTECLEEGPDTDLDDLPDAWELEQTSDLSVLAGTGNFDGDRFTDAEEFIYDTDPLVADNDDPLQLTFTLVDEATKLVQLGWNTSPRRQYRIFSGASIDMSGDLTDTGAGPFVGVSPSATQMLDLPDTQEDAFFRVHVSLPLGK